MQDVGDHISKLIQRDPEHIEKRQGSESNWRIKLLLLNHCVDIERGQSDQNWRHVPNTRFRIVSITGFGDLEDKPAAAHKM